MLIILWNIMKHVYRTTCVHSMKSNILIFVHDKLSCPIFFQYYVILILMHKLSSSFFVSQIIA